jgi:transposase-like protein
VELKNTINQMQMKFSGVLLAVTTVATRCKESGMSVSQIAERMDIKEEYAQEWLGDNAGEYKKDENCSAIIMAHKN